MQKMAKPMLPSQDAGFCMKKEPGWRPRSRHMGADPAADGTYLPIRNAVVNIGAIASPFQNACPVQHAQVLGHIGLGAVYFFKQCAHILFAGLQGRNDLQANRGGHGPQKPGCRIVRAFQGCYLGEFWMHGLWAWVCRVPGLPKRYVYTYITLIKTLKGPARYFSAGLLSGTCSIHLSGLLSGMALLQVLRVRIHLRAAVKMRPLILRCRPAVQGWPSSIPISIARYWVHA